MRVLFSFPLRLGADRICGIAWQQVNGLAAAGADVLVFPASISRPVASNVRVSPTLARGKLRLPYKILGTMRACALHDRIVARRLKKLAGKIDIIHAWPLGALETLETARQLGIPTALERCNAHTGFAMEVVQKECDRLGIVLPPDHEHAFDAEKLRKEESEYRLATSVLCPSDFVVKTFLDKGYPREQLARHTYGYDEKVFYPEQPAARTEARTDDDIRGGVRGAERSALRPRGVASLPGFERRNFSHRWRISAGLQEKLSSMLAHPSVKVLGHRNDVPELMRKSDILVLPSIEEGFGLVIAEAMGSGCVPLASEACTEICRHMKTGLMHRVGDVDALTQHITMLHQDRALLEKLRTASLEAASGVTWAAAGRVLLDAYRETIAAYRAGALRETAHTR